MVLLGLYVAQSVPMSFFSTVVPVIMRQEHYSLESIGMLQLIKLPWLVKFFWAPLVDKTSTSLKHFRKWIFFSELFYAVVILFISFFSLQTDFTLIIALMVVAFIGSATQDIATDAYAIHILEPDERGIGNSMQSSGSFIGTLMGSGALLILYHYFGWQVLLWCLAVFVIIALIPLWFYKSNRNAEVRNKDVATIKFVDIGNFFTQKGALKRIVFLLFFYSGIIGILTMLKPFLVDEGYTVKQIGVISGVFGTLVGALVSLLAGVLIKKQGRRRMIRIAFLLMLIAAAFMYVITLSKPSVFEIYLGAALVWGAYGAASVIVFTTSMDWIRLGREGTDFTLQIVITHIGSMIVAISSGKIAHSLGYNGLFLIEMIVATVLLVVSFWQKAEMKRG